ncbi:hypothetical protein BHE74_00037033, partial [Ensete ventricosum]
MSKRPDSHWKCIRLLRVTEWSSERIRRHRIIRFDRGERGGDRRNGSMGEVEVCAKESTRRASAPSTMSERKSDSIREWAKARVKDRAKGEMAEVELGTSVGPRESPLGLC